MLRRGGALAFLDDPQLNQFLDGFVAMKNLLVADTRFADTDLEFIGTNQTYDEFHSPALVEFYGLLITNGRLGRTSTRVTMTRDCSFLQGLQSCGGSRRDSMVGNIEKTRTRDSHQVRIFTEMKIDQLSFSI